ncbi:HAD family hydrolase [Peredibacter starrii]|uniref:HAD family hydrolase n=1 Tax=Peredibacter starrii TaxID=28202 RepID=A0AAX4HLW6_9BACT|nr:HAD family hydrolase [Peredibacter starrii]WPU64206.1 HAD family hydrolase [Peredibacter starrii]
MKNILITLSFLLIACATPKKEKAPPAPLPSWANTQVKENILDYIKVITDPKNPDFIPVEDRIATFDNDGTIWAEKPVVQGLFAIERAKEMGMKVSPRPSEKEFLKIVLKTHTGMTDEAFEKEVKEFFDTALHPTYKVPIDQTVYQPQLELMQLLKDHGFTIYISSGGTIEFMRTFSQRLYQIPGERVIGSNFAYAFEPKTNQLNRLQKFEFNNDKEKKPIGIQRNIGKRPVIACGNVGNEGDVQMLRYSQGSKYRSLQLLVNHDDGAREFVYGEPKNTSLNWAQQYKWNVISMKKDWLKVFPDKKEAVE